MRLADLTHTMELSDPPWYRAIFANTVMAPLWLLVRVYVGWQWLDAGWHKVSGDNWTNNDGAALEGFWVRIVAVPEQGRPAIRYDWYRDVIQFMLDHDWHVWFAWVIAFGELFIGLALIIGLFTGFAAIAGAFLNFNFMLAGSAGTNPVLFLLAVLIMLAWKVSGRIGVDRWLLPALGTPWSHGVLAEDAGARPAPGGQPPG